MKNTIWRNNKTGNLYVVKGVVRHSETLDTMVVYMLIGKHNPTELDEDENIHWVRPYDLFFQKFTKVEK